MESINNNKVKYRFLVFILAFMVAIAPLGNIKKVEALSPSDLKLVSPFIIGLILTSLVASGAVSGGYQVSPVDLSSITEKAQANLQAAGSAAIDQANKLGEAIKSGATSAAIKGLAKGSVIYAFLTAIQEVLFPDISAQMDVVQSSHPVSYKFMGYSAGRLFYSEQTDTNFNYPLSGFSSETYIQGNTYLYCTKPLSQSEIGNYSPLTIHYGDSRLLGQTYIYSSTKTDTGAYHFTINYNFESEIAFGALLGIPRCIALSGGAFYDPTVSNIAGRENITLPTVLPHTIINNITNWDGTSDLVLSPPLPYDIPDDEALVIDPGYVGPDVIDPTDPVDPPAEEGTIVLPWLAALLGLLGLGNPSLEGIEAGVKTAIDKLIEGITATTQGVYDGTKEKIDAITGALSGIDATVQSGIDALTGSISVPLTNIADFALSVPDFFAIPEGKSIATPIIEQIPTVFPIVDQMNTALNKITVETRPLIIYYPYLDGSTKEINLNWYEPAREQVKHGVGLLFKVVTALACFAMISNVFGIGIRVGTGQAYTDNNSGGGGNSRKKED